MRILKTSNPFIHGNPVLPPHFIGCKKEHCTALSIGYFNKDNPVPLSVNRAVAKLRPFPSL
jgi:hypothetical protein